MEFCSVARLLVFLSLHLFFCVFTSESVLRIALEEMASFWHVILEFFMDCIIFQEDFDEFSDVDELYSTLPLDKVESLEDLVTVGPPGLVKVIYIQIVFSFSNLFR